LTAIFQMQDSHQSERLEGRGQIRGRLVRHS
jgi:hypothetical protein